MPQNQKDQDPKKMQPGQTCDPKKLSGSEKKPDDGKPIPTRAEQNPATRPDQQRAR